MLTRWDRVHPGEAGHSIMAWTFLKAQDVDPVVSDVAVDAATLAVSRSVNAEVSGVAHYRETRAALLAEQAKVFALATPRPHRYWPFRT